MFGGMLPHKDGGLSLHVSCSFLEPQNILDLQQYIMSLYTFYNSSAVTSVSYQMFPMSADEERVLYYDVSKGIVYQDVSVCTYSQCVQKTS